MSNDEPPSTTPEESAGASRSAYTEGVIDDLDREVAACRRDVEELQEQVSNTKRPVYVDVPGSSLAVLTFLVTDWVNLQIAAMKYQDAVARRADAAAQRAADRAEARAKEAATIGGKADAREHEANMRERRAVWRLKHPLVS